MINYSVYSLECMGIRVGTCVCVRNSVDGVVKEFYVYPDDCVRFFSMLGDGCYTWCGAMDCEFADETFVVGDDPNNMVVTDMSVAAAELLRLGSLADRFTPDRIACSLLEKFSSFGVVGVGDFILWNGLSLVCVGTGGTGTWRFCPYDDVALAVKDYFVGYGSGGSVTVFCGDYRYSARKDNVHGIGWGICVVDRSKVSYESVMGLFGYPVVDVFYVFVGCSKMLRSPELPDSVSDITMDVLFV